MKRITLTFIIVMTLACVGQAQERSDSALIYFRQSKSAVDTSYMGNSRRLDSMSAVINALSSPGAGYALRRVSVVGGASPEGSVEINRRLSAERAEGIFRYLRQHVALPDSLTSFTYLGRDWRGLYDMVAADQNVPSRDDVLRLLDDIMSETSDDNNFDPLPQLMGLHGGAPYRYMYSHLFPALRASRMKVDYYRAAEMLPISDAPRLRYEISDVECTLPDMVPKKERKPFYMALKTNLLYDLLAVPNIGAEFYIGKNWSVAGNWMYGWWDDNSVHRYWRIYGGDIALRRWFGSKADEKPLTGHHVGVYAGVVTYDFEFGGKGYMGGLPGRTLWDRCNMMAGVEYGYSLPVARRLNLDFTIGIGYLGGKYIEYITVAGCYEWQSTHNLCWIGPTKAEVALVWLIGHGNYNSRKGGKR